MFTNTHSMPKNRDGLGCYCVLDTGEKKAYDLCDPYVPGQYPPEIRGYRYMGHGTIFSVNGRRQSDPDEYYFYRRA